jgi:hypothetical protein
VQENLNTPLTINLKLDPFERFTESRGFDEWQENRGWTIAPAMAKVQEFFASFKEYPPRMRSMESNPDAMIEQMMQSTSQ